MRLNKFLLILYIIMFCGMFLHAQSPSNYFYIVSADSTLFGIVNDEGDTTIHMKEFNNRAYSHGDIVEDSILDVFISSIDPTYKADYERSLAITNTAIVDKDGRAYYFPLWFDNGSDYYNEQYRRIVDTATGKVGFANHVHEIVIPPTWDFATPFNYGYAEVFNNYKRTYLDKYKEYWTIEPAGPHAWRGVINKRGEVVSATPVKHNDRDYTLYDMEGFFPNPFIYDEAAQQVLNNIPDKAMLYELFEAQYAKTANLEDMNISYEITSYPTANDHHYYIQLYLNQEGAAYHRIRYHATNHQYEHLQYYEDWVTIDQYILDKLLEIQTYRDHFNDTLPFDVEANIQKYSAKVNASMD